MITVEIDKKDQRELERQFKRLIAVTKEPVEDILAQQGRLFAVEAARYTGRYGDKPYIGKKHKLDVEKTVKRIYKRALSAKGLIAMEMGAKAAVRFENYIRRRNTSAAQAMADRANLSKYYKGRNVKIIMWDGGNAHTRWTRSTSGKDHVNLVMDYPKVKKFIVAKKKNVGEAKAGWAKAAEMLGGSRGIPAYAKKGHRTRGYGNVKGTGSKAELTVAHYGKYGFTKTSMTGVWRSRTKMIGKQIEKIINSKSKKIVK